MKKIQSSLSNMVVVLTSTALLSGSVLAGVNYLTEGPVKKQNEKQLSEGIKTVMCSDNVVVKTSTPVSMMIEGDTCRYVVHTVGLEPDGKYGYAVESSTMGFGGILKVLVGFDDKGTVLGYKILQSQETPGLGQKAGQWFQKGEKGCIIGRKVSRSQPLVVGKEEGQVDAITASTITSKAFVRAVNNAYQAMTQVNMADMHQPTDAETGASERRVNREVLETGTMHNTEGTTGASGKAVRKTSHCHEKNADRR